MKIAAAFILFFISFACLMYYMLGMHGHLMFRPHMRQDWEIWGTAVITFAAGLILFIKGVRGIRKKILSEKRHRKSNS